MNPEHRSRKLSRRRFLVVGGAGAVSVGLTTRYPTLFAAAAQEPSFTLDLVRREDMALLGFEFHNLALSTSGTTPTLTRIDTQQPSLVVVQLGSQHLMEEPLPWENEEPDPLRPVGEIATRALAPSRVAFLLPQTLKSFPFTEDGLFGWWRWVMRVHGRALAPGQPIPGDLPDFDPAMEDHPAEDQTDLLLVDWLHLSPDRFSTWLHATRPVTRDGRTELWHTRLRPRNDDGRPDTSTRAPTIRAVSSDKSVSAADKVFTVLRPGGQEDVPEQIVALTTHYEIDPPNVDVISPVTADLLVLSPIGSSVELAGIWGPGIPQLSIAKWLHRSTLGRDNYVRVETRGFLFPFGHRATLISETERRIASNGAAYLFQRQFIYVREPVKTYPGYGDDTFEGRRFPFREIRLTTTVTPDLPPDEEWDFIPASTKSFWVPTRDPATDEVHDLPFPVIATDWEGKTVQFSASLVYVDQAEAQDDSSLDGLLSNYTNYDSLEVPDSDYTVRRTVTMSGEKIAFAVPDQPGDTAYPVSKLYLGAYAGETAATTLAELDLPNFYPAMLVAEVRIPAVEALAGEGAVSYIGYDKTFTTTPAAKAAADNVGDTFARVQSTLGDLGDVMYYLDGLLAEPPSAQVAVRFANAGANVGGVALPDLDVGALSRKFGPLSGGVDSITAMETGEFTPADFFPDSASLLGGITLKDVIDALPLDVEGGGGPTIVTTMEYDNGENAPPTAIVVTLDWAPRIFGPDEPDDPPASFLSFIPYGMDDKHATLTMHGELRTVFGGDTTSTIKGEVRDFTLSLIKPEDPLLDFIALTFNRFAFEQHNDTKPTFDPDIAKVEFKGPLSFINTLQQYLSPGGGSGPNALGKSTGTAVVPLAGPTIDVQPSGVTLGYTLEIPTVSVGVFSLQNMSFSAGITLPFDGKPVSGRFGFASPDNRFVVSVYIFGGGGYFALDLDTEGLRRLEAAIEFGGVLALSIVVASGSLSVMAGIYFKLERNETTGENDVTLAGYLRAVGRLSVLGLITVTAEFYLALEYKSADNSMEGIAILKITVEVLVFSKTVEIEVRKKFAGPGGSGKRALAAAQHEFGDLMSQSDWNAYIDSFAA